MKKKSKVTTFILSMIPGLGHIYLGFAARGCTFFAAFIGTPLLLMSIFDIVRWWGLDRIIPVPLLVIWLAAMIDAMILIDRINGNPNVEVVAENSGSIIPDYSSMFRQNKKVIAMLLSIIPGAGHLYLGLQRQGIELMAGFFLSFYLTDWLRISIFMIFAPIIWFVSMFDVMHKAAGDRPMDDKSIFPDKWFNMDEGIISEKSFLRSKQKVLANMLIIVGLYLLLSRFVYSFIKPYLDSRITDNIQTGFVALLLIAGGIKLLLGSKVTKNDIKTETVNE